MRGDEEVDEVDDEGRARIPKIMEEEFNAGDVNGDGFLEADEMNALL